MKLALSFGDTPTPAPIPSVLVPLSQHDTGFYIGFFLNVFYIVGILAALAYILYGGWRWVTSQGDPKEVKNARETIVYSLIGLGVIFMAILVVNFVGAFFGIHFLGQ